MLEKGQLLPHFTVRTIDAEAIDYSAIWQHRNLVLVTVPAEEPHGSRHYAGAMANRRTELDRLDAVGIVTHDAIPGVPSPGWLVADRWGEIAVVSRVDRLADLPSLDELFAWLRYVQIRCAECEGEAR